MDNWSYQHAENPVIIGGCNLVSTEVYTSDITSGTFTLASKIDSTAYSDWQSIEEITTTTAYNNVVIASDKEIGYLSFQSIASGLQNLDVHSIEVQFGHNDTELLHTIGSTDPFSFRRIGTLSWVSYHSTTTQPRATQVHFHPLLIRLVRTIDGSQSTNDITINQIRIKWYLKQARTIGTRTGELKLEGIGYNTLSVLLQQDPDNFLLAGAIGQ